NGIADPNLIRAGQMLILHGTNSESAQPAPRPLPTTAPAIHAPRVQHKPVKAIYVSFFAIGSQDFRDHVFDLIENTEINAVVIDVKGDRGYVAFPSQVPLATEIGALDYLTMKDIDELMAYLKARNIYTIARIVVFKDDPLAQARPDLAVRDGRTGSLWIDNEGLAWTDPFREEVWDYNIALAREAAEKGFDEIQFDYTRFPTDGDMDGALFSRPSTQENRQAAIQGFLARAWQALKPLGAKLAVDTFGYTAWLDDDMGIGQKLEDLAPFVDVISPMVYPSTFRYGIPDYPNAVAHPYEIVYYSLNKAMDRLDATGVEVRPWLQDFPDYAFDKRPYTSVEVLAQKKASYDAGASGWMLWDPRVKYTRDALAPP
ncbi:MAG: putative glycoside hydrolase, partial [Dehalococcoidia bacterium]|nr:putative glycoside hydrolase [Dehalococcoidia bacterium]